MTRIREPRIRLDRAPRIKVRAARLEMKKLREMKRQAYAMGNLKEIARINKIIAFYTGEVQTSRRRW